MDVTICIGTYGGSVWKRMAAVAASSVPDGVPVIHSHGDTLAQARNAALNQVETEWTIHLDADDKLDDRYIEEMAKGSCDLRAPSFQRVRNGSRFGEPYMPQVSGHEHACEASCLRAGNWMVIGTCVRTALAREVGGWEEWEWSEDWALWARCWVAGGTVEALPEAVYWATWRPDSRNRVGRATSANWHRAIEEAIWPDEESLL